MKPRVKICGLTRPEDARLSAELGATHLGAILTSASRRRVTPVQARQVLGAGGGAVEWVLVFKGESPEVIISQAREVGARNVELYDGTEEVVHAVEEAGLTVYRVYPVRASARALPRFSKTPTPDAPAVLDTGGGGSGTPFPWSLLGKPAPPATFIAGGITPENVTALLAHEPYGIDLSSGVESAPGVKDRARLELLFRRLEGR